MKEKLIIEIFTIHCLTIYIYFMMGTEGLLRYCLLVASFYSLNSGQVNIWILKQFGILGLGGIETVWDFWVGVLEQFAKYKDFGTV